MPCTYNDQADHFVYVYRTHNTTYPQSIHMNERTTEIIETWNKKKRNKTTEEKRKKKKQKKHYVYARAGAADSTLPAESAKLFI